MIALMPFGVLLLALTLPADLDLAGNYENWTGSVACTIDDAGNVFNQQDVLISDQSGHWASECRQLARNHRNQELRDIAFGMGALIGGPFGVHLMKRELNRARARLEGIHRQHNTAARQLAALRQDSSSDRNDA